MMKNFIEGITASGVSMNCAEVLARITKNSIVVVLNEDNPGLVDFRKELGPEITCKVGRFLRATLGFSREEISDSQIAALTSWLRAQGEAWRVAEGGVKDIMAGYRHSIGDKSCMTGIERQGLVEFYSMITNGAVAGLYYFDADMILPTSRALLWTDVEGRKIIDRIYPNTGYRVERIRRWAESKQYWIRETHSAPMSYDPVGIVHSVTGERTINSRIQIELSDRVEFPRIMPYMDTFCYLSSAGAGRIILAQKPMIGVCGYCRETAGNYSKNTFVECRICKNAITSQASYRLIIVNEKSTLVDVCQNCVNTLIRCGRCGRYVRKPYPSVLCPICAAEERKKSEMYDFVLITPLLTNVIVKPQEEYKRVEIRGRALYENEDGISAG
jgi:hypothetical protein